MTDRTFCIAPMMDYTDRHHRYLMRLLAPHARLFTEMVVTGMILHGDVKRHLQYDPSEHPLVLQLGGSDPEELARCAVQAQQFDYDEVNLNVGCPSGKVAQGAFGACLMKQPRRVADCVAAIRKRVDIPVSVKCRIGVDEQDVEESLSAFIDTVSGAGCRIFYVHARKALLSGLSPKQNRTIPPLNYDRVYRLKQQFPTLEIILNGGIRSAEEAHKHLQQVDGVMVGRLAYEDHAAIREIEVQLFSETALAQLPLEVLEKYLPYMDEQCQQGVPLAHMTRHISSLFRGCAQARKWRQATHCPVPDMNHLHHLRSLAQEIAAA